MKAAMTDARRQPRARHVADGPDRPGVRNPCHGDRSNRNELQDQSRGDSHEPHEPDRGVHVVVAVPGDRVRLQHYGGGQLAVAYLYGQLGDRRDLGYLKRRSARGPGLGRILIAEVPE
jgi:hypothetical protein